MVYAFFVGAFIGLPLGCYMRETGVAHKLQAAYNVLVPRANANQSEKLKSRSDEFYQNIKKGQVDPKDFEKYIYGGTYAKRSSD